MRIKDIGDSSFISPSPVACSHKDQGYFGPSLLRTKAPSTNIRWS